MQLTFTKTCVYDGIVQPLTVTKYAVMYSRLLVSLGTEISIAFLLVVVLCCCVLCFFSFLLQIVVQTSLLFTAKPHIQKTNKK